MINLYKNWFLKLNVLQQGFLGMLLASPAVLGSMIARAYSFDFPKFFVLIIVGLAVISIIILFRLLCILIVDFLKVRE